LEERADQPSNFVKHEFLVRKKEIRTIGSRGLWTVDLASVTRKFGFWKNEKEDFTKHEIVKCLEGLSPSHSEGSYGWRIREELAHASPLSGFRRLGES